MFSDLSFFEKVLEIFSEHFDLFLYGVEITLLVAVVGTIGGLIIGLILSIARSYEAIETDSWIKKCISKILKFFVKIYVWFFRGTPMMVQAIFFYYLLRPVLGWDALTAGLTIISINTGAYMAEIIRSGIQSVDYGQVEGARSIGMSSFQTLYMVVLPQAIKNSFPSIGNQLIINIKDSCMLNAIGVVELFFQSSSIAGTFMLFTETYFITMIIYLGLTSIATFILNCIEKRMDYTKQSTEVTA